MNILEFKGVSKSFFTQKLYKKVNLEINSGDKIALIGNNGVGKSTFIKMITDEERPDYGCVDVNEEAKIVVFDQFGKVDQDKKVDELLNQPFEKVISVQHELEAVSTQFSDNTEENEKLLERYSELSDEFESLGGYSYLHIQSEFIEVFGLEDKLDKTFRQLSGGEKQYLRLAITLFSDADLVILDEPLSFFDRKKTAWLAEYVNNSEKAFLIISHNIDFIRGFSNKIFDIDNNTITAYECGHQQFLKEKKAKLAQDRKQNIKTEDEILDTHKAIERKLILLEKCNNKHAHAVILKRMRKELEKLQRQRIEFSPDYKYEYTAAPDDVLFAKRDLGSEIISIKNVSKEYPGKVLYKGANLDIEKDTKICLVGENGAGKSTLLRILLGKEEPTTGTVLVNNKAKIAFIEQETVFEDENIYIKDYLKEKTGLSDDFIEAAIDNLYNNEIEFRDKRIFMLSGGEKKRLEIFANILWEADLLIIDEPTTYMDDYSRGLIANMLMDYEGAVVLVSHDKVLMRQIDGFVTYDIRDRLLRVKEFGA
nr:ATP-binding cassette domain-containing protein [uncultured Cetobacterium sp.]